MIRMVHRILVYAGPHYARRIRASYVFAFLKSCLINAPLLVAIGLVGSLLDNTLTLCDCLVTAVQMPVLMAIAAICQNMTDRLQSAAGYQIFAEKRLAFAEHLRRLPMGYFTAGNLGRISSILSADMVFIEENAMTIVADVVSNLCAEAVVVLFLFWLHPYLGALALGIVLLAFLIALPMNREAMRNSVRRQAANEALTDAVLEYTEGLAVSKSFGLTGESAAALRDGIRAQRDANLSFERQHTPWERGLNLLYGVGIAGELALAIHLLEQGAISRAWFVGVLLMLFGLFAPIRAMLQNDTRLTIMASCLDRIGQVMGETPIANDGTETLRSDAEHAIEFRGVSFSYGAEEVLHDISFTADRGQMLALVGESGSGKTTIANLLARFWDVSSGAVLVQGADIRNLPMAALMSQISMVFQNVYLFEDTVYNNIAMGREGATREEVLAAARAARCHEFIMRLPYGYDTVIGEGGASLSGGERQRIAIARCILKDAPIVILDEATASLDADNERAIQEAMTALCRDKTTIVIAHRLNTIRSADEILVIDKGRIAEHGTHADLMAAGGLYCHMQTLQGGDAGWNERGEVSA